jgi:hypothetical protein
MLLLCWCFNERDHTLTIEPIVPVHWQPETGAVREYNHFSILKVYVLVHGYRQTFRDGLQLICHVFRVIYILLSWDF